MNKRLAYIAVILLLVGGIVLSLPQQGLTEATTITPSSASVSTSVDYCFGFDIDNDLAGTPGDIAAGDYFSIEFASDFDLTNLAIADDATTEVSVYLGATDCTGTERLTETTQTADNDKDYAVVSGDKLTITMEDAIATTFSVEFHDEAADDSVTTPASAGNYAVNYEWGTGSTVDGQDSDLLYVGNANEVNISGSVDPSITLSLANWTDYTGAAGTANTCDLGTLSSTNINTCSYSAAITTNATSGYTASIAEDQIMSSGTDDIDDVTGGAVVAGTEAYGASTTQASQTITRINDADSSTTYTQDDCSALTGQSSTNANASSLATSNQAFSSATGPTDDTVYLCHAASVAGDTPAGLYTHTVTITVVGNF